MWNSSPFKKAQEANSVRPNLGLNFVSGQRTVSQSMDFNDTAAVLANCDLLISADSAVVHLAGAMGIPTWMACGGSLNGAGA